MKKEEILKAYADELERIGKSENTAKGYLHNISMFLTWLEDTSGESFSGSLTPVEVKAYRSYIDTVKKVSLSIPNLQRYRIFVISFMSYMEMNSLKLRRRKARFPLK